MLSSIHIQNVAIIRDLEIDFTSGFQVLTGETGSGKSIIIDSMGLLSGGKTDKSIIRTGESSACVSGIFGNFSKTNIDFLKSKDIHLDEDGNIFVQRTIFLDGKNKIKINGSPVSLTTLKELSKVLLDLHGQSDSLELYDTNTYIDILDSFSQIEDLKEKYKCEYDEYTKLKQELSELTKSESERVRLIEMLTYQIHDIDSHKLKIGEEEELQELEIRVKNHEKISKQTNFAYHYLKGSEKANACLILERSAQAIEGLSGVISSADEMAKQLRDALATVEDVSEQIFDILDSTKENSKDINQIEERLDIISKLKRKYGATIEEILKYSSDAKDKLTSIQNADGRILEIQDLLNKKTIVLTELGEKLHTIRVNSSKSLEKDIISTLVYLDMPNVRFEIQIQKSLDENNYLFLPNGIDLVDFMISANKGEDLNSLSKVASGGELARIMLALKTVENAKDTSTTMIFDEIDTGVSGKTARKIGYKLLELSKQTQIFCITHSAQIASLADVHYRISKSEINSRTETKIEILDETGRIDELSRILGGIHITEAQKQAAIDMREEKKNLARSK